MSDVLENEVATDPGLYEETKSWLTEHGVNEIDAVKASRVIVAFAINFGKTCVDPDLLKQELKYLRIVVGKTAIVLDASLNYAEEQNLTKAVATALASYFVADVVGTIAGTILAGLGAGTITIVGAGIVVTVATGLAVDYLVDESWDVFIGPTIKAEVDEVNNRYGFITYGKLSRFLIPGMVFWLISVSLKTFGNTTISLMHHIGELNQRRVNRLSLSMITLKGKTPIVLMALNVPI